MYGKSTERDELRGRFTKWMEVLLLREKRKYLHKRKADEMLLFLDDLPEEALPTAGEPHVCSFDFEQDRLAEAFLQLPPERQKILTLLFAQEWKASEIAERLNCSPQHVYDQKYQAIKALQQGLQRKEGERK